MILKTAWRHLGRAKIATLIHVMGLTLGIAACLTIYLICDYEFHFDRFHPDGDRIYRINEVVPLTSDRTAYVNKIPPPAPAILRAEVTGLQELTAFYPIWTRTKIHRRDNSSPEFDCHVAGSQMSTTILADSGYFGIFRYTWLAGSPSGEFLKPNRVVLTESRARSYFGESDPDNFLGREIIYNDSLRVVVAGIVQDWKEKTDFPFTDFISLATIRDKSLRADYDPGNWNGRSAMCFVKLPAGLSPAAPAGELRSFIRRHDVSEPNTRIRLELQPLTDIHFDAGYHGEDLRTAHKPTLYGLMAIAGLILTLAILNFVNLSSAQSLERMKETGIRKILGSPKGQIRLQALTEAGLITMLSALLAMLLLPVIFRVFEDFIPEGMNRFSLTPGRGLFLLAVATITALAAGFYPASLLAGFEPTRSLKGLAAQPDSRPALVRKGMIVFQFSISILFIFCAIILHAQLTFIRNRDLGLNTEKVLMISAGGSKGQTGIGLLDETIKKIPGVTETAKQILPPVGTATFGLQFLPRDDKQEPMNIIVRGGNERFIPFYRIRLLAGRNLRRSDSLSELVINESLARRLGYLHPAAAIGQTLTTGKDNFPELSGKTLPIVGVVADFTIFSLHEQFQPVVIAHIPVVEDKLAIRLAAGGTETTIRKIEKAWKELYPGENFDYRFLDESISALYQDERRTSTLLTAAVSISIFISCIGLFGIMLHSVRSRTREIGIRKVLGASVAGLVYLLNRQYLRLIMLAFLIATPVAFLFMNRWLETFAFRIHISGWHFLLAAFFALGIALFTVISLAVKAAVANPVISLRSE